MYLLAGWKRELPTDARFTLEKSRGALGFSRKEFFGFMCAMEVRAAHYVVKDTFLHLRHDMISSIERAVQADREVRRAFDTCIFPDGITLQGRDRLFAFFIKEYIGSRTENVVTRDTQQEMYEAHELDQKCTRDRADRRAFKKLKEADKAGKGVVEEEEENT